MKHFIIFIFGLSLLHLFACHSSKKQTTTKAEKSDEISLTGSFESKKGVMVSLSCYCYNCGYLTTSDGESVSVCIEDKNTDIDCKKPTLKGKYVTVTKEKDANGVCSGGTITYFMVSSVICD
jgi:hypothetical protein